MWSVPPPLGLPRLVSDRLDMCSTASCPLRTLHAVSVMGTRLCFYCVGTQDSDGKIITPIAIPDNPLKVIDNVPSNRWELDILEPAGDAQFREIIQEIMDGCHALDAFRSHRYDLETSWPLLYAHRDCNDDLLASTLWLRDNRYVFRCTRVQSRAKNSRY